MYVVALAVVEQALAAAAATVAGRGRRVPDIVEAGFAREVASGAAAAPGRCFGGTRLGIERGLRAVLTAHHGANAAEKQRAADHAGRG